MFKAITTDETSFIVVLSLYHGQTEKTSYVKVVSNCWYWTVNQFIITPIKMNISQYY